MPAQENIGDVITKVFLMFALVLFLTLWCSIGFILWLSMLSRAFASVGVSMTAILLNQGDPRIYVERLRQVIAIWPEGFRMALDSFGGATPTGTSGTVASGVPPIAVLMREITFSILFYGSLWVILFHADDVIAFIENPPLHR